MQDLLSRLGTLDSKIDPLPLEQIARTAGFVKRSPRKADARQWLRAICLLSVLPARSFRTLGWLLGLIEGSCHSKQNVGKRINDGFICFLQQVLELFTARLAGANLQIDHALKVFDRIIVQDSTVIGLPAHLARHFPGASNQTGKPIAGMRVQAFFDLLSESCLWFSIAPFTRNDQRASADILEVARPGDLVVRDLGYSSLQVFEHMQAAGIDFLSRLKYGTLLFDKNGEPLDLLHELQKSGRLDVPVHIGAKTRVPVRVVAVPVPETVAAERRRKARNNRDRRTNPSKDRMRLLGWTILITTVQAELLAADLLVRAYGLRWRIETLFKAWKSHFRLGRIPACASAAFVCALILAGLLYVAVFQCLFQTLQRKEHSTQLPLSPLKLASLVQNLAAIELNSCLENLPDGSLMAITLYHCKYDRRQRINYYQQLANFALG